jgi:hypothetical protein
MASRFRDSNKKSPPGVDAEPKLAVADRTVENKPTEDEIRMLAYQKWASAGMPPGDGVNFWREAEQELLGWIRSTPS